MEAYVLIGLRGESEQAVLEELTSHVEVVEGHVLFGEWDLIIKLDVESAEAAGTFVMEEVRKLDEVKLTSTLIVAK